MTSSARLPFIRQRGAVPRVLLWAAGAVAALALVWTLLIGWWLPGFLKPRIEAAGSEALGAPLVLDRIELAPWRLEAVISGLRLGPAEASWLRIAELRADLSIESLWRLAPVLERVLVREPQVELERLAPGRYNITPMLEVLAKQPPAPPDAKPARFALNNIRLEGGRIHIVDRVSRSEHHVEGLQIGVPFVSNLPSQVTIDVEPLLDAQVNGSRLQVQGKTQPFAEGRRSHVDVSWQQLDVPRWVEAFAPLLPQALPVDVSRGKLDLQLAIGFEQRPAPAAPLLRIEGGAALSQLQAVVPAQGARVAVERLAVQGLDLQPLERKAVIGSIRLQAPQLEVDLPRLTAAAPAPAGKDRLVLSDAPASAVSSASAAGGAASVPAAAGDTGGWQWRVDKLELAEGRVLLTEPAWPQGQALTPITLAVSGLDARADAPPATLALSLVDAQGAEVQVDGTLSVAARSARLKADVAGFKPTAWLTPWQALLPVRVLGADVALQAQAEVGPTGWSVSEGALQLTGVELQPVGAVAPPPPVARKAAGKLAQPATATDRLRLTRLDVSGLQVGARTAAPIVARIAAVKLDGLDFEAARNERGVIGWQSPPAETAATTPAAAQEPKAIPPRWQVGELSCSNCSVTLSDRSVKPVAAFGIARTDLKLRQLDSDLTKPLSFELATALQHGGRLRASGTARPQPLALRSKVDLESLDLRALQPYVEARLNVALVSAKVSARGDLQVDGTPHETVSLARWRGRLALKELRMLDQINQAEFVRFKGLQLDGADVGWRPAAVEADLGSVSLDDFYGRVIVNADGRINLSRIVKRPGDAVPRSLTSENGADAASAPATPELAFPATAAASAASAPAGSAAPPPQVRWREIRLAGGTVDFTDNFIRPNYSAKLTDIAGEVSALAWNNPQPATVKISGKVDGAAPLEISGTMHPLGPRLATDITASARGIDITRLTAYSGRYAGYGIEKGTLSVKVRYKIENGKLEAENNVYLDQLTFGDKIDSPDALKLPVLLAVSLLKDRNGVIDIDLPISGSLDDPQFSVGRIIVRVIVNLITKAITAPFSLLASAFGGGGGQELGFVEFTPGSTELSDASRQRLDTLAKALTDRPALKLEATGRADAAVDEPALRAQYLDSLVRAAKAQSTGELAESVKIEPTERARWLEAAYKAADLKAKPRNVIGLAKSLPPAEMEALLLASAPAGEPALKTLADQRGDRVKAYLTAKVPPERVLLTASKLGAEGIDDKGATTRVAFALK
ncbi:DUF748 domain-containing protein [Methylibium sp.]|jgi:hypothetical protein|uniref:DUF748 domain-containing protein n=1 Tax=Methylibium sp. TaxID=2067992 RepID=UPI003F6EDF17